MHFLRQQHRTGPPPRCIGCSGTKGSDAECASVVGDGDGDGGRDLWGGGWGVGGGCGLARGGGEGEGGWRGGREEGKEGVERNVRRHANDLGQGIRGGGGSREHVEAGSGGW